MTNNEALLKELERLREQYQQLGGVTVELLAALDAVIKRGDAQGSVGPKDQVWYRAKAALARATGAAIPQQPPAAPPDSQPT